VRGSRPLSVAYGVCGLPGESVSQRLEELHDEVGKVLWHPLLEHPLARGLAGDVDELRAYESATCSPE
jgi:hypothetical protein